MMYVQTKQIMQGQTTLMNFILKKTRMPQQIKKINGTKFLEAIDILNAEVTKILKI